MVDCGERQPIGDVLLTGATGYLGMHVLNELLTNYEGRIFCPLRAKIGEDAMHRLKTMFNYYFGKTPAFERIDSRVTAFAAEVTQPDYLLSAHRVAPDSYFHYQHSRTERRRCAWSRREAFGTNPLAGTEHRREQVCVFEVQG